MQKMTTLEQPADPVAYHGWILRDVLFDSGEPVGHREPQPAKERNFCERCGKRLGVADHIHTCTPPQPDDEHDELFCWKVHGTSDEFTGYYAEEEAKAVAKRIGGTCFAFPLYVKPQTAREWVGLSTEDYTAIQARIPDTDTVCEFVFADIVASVEVKLKEKNL